MAKAAPPRLWPASIRCTRLCARAIIFVATTYENASFEVGACVGIPIKTPRAGTAVFWADRYLADRLMSSRVARAASATDATFWLTGRLKSLRAGARGALRRRL